MSQSFEFVSTMCLLTYMYHPLLQAIEKSMEASTTNTGTDAQNRLLVYTALFSGTLRKHEATLSPNINTVYTNCVNTSGISAFQQSLS